MKKLLFIMLLSIPVSAQTGILTLYTQSNCNNCKYAKYMLQKNGIAFREFPLDDQATGAEMLKKLKSAGYADKIYLPVIFEDDTVVLHPKVPHNDSTLYVVIQKIIAEKESYASDSGPMEIMPSSDEEDGDCVMTMEVAGD